MNVAVDKPSPSETEQRPSAKTHRRLAYTASGSLAAITLLAFTSYWFSTGRYLETTDDAYVRSDWVALSPRVAGYVAEVEVADDQPVKAGDVLVRLQNRDYRARLDQAQAGVTAAQAALAAAQASQQVATARIDQQQQAILQAEAVVRSATAEQRRSELDVQRYRGLVRDDAATMQRLETASAHATQAQAALQGARAALRQQRSQLAMAKARSVQAEAELQQRAAALAGAQAHQRLAEQDEQDTVIRAPITGVVGQRRVRTGQYVVPGQPLLAVVPLQQAYVVANYKETQLARMRPGQPVEIRVDSFASQPLQGHVASFSPASGNVFALLPSDNATGNFTKIVQRFPVRILLDKPLDGPQVLPGMSVVSTVDTRPAEVADAH
ncbi:MULTISPECIES: HlyD family secretion protein [Pseudomonas]|uniref:HlyD family secretion protein n=1 Tax=Pseudomonas TaxID=286 RepID=UPI001AE78D6B|nr:MULTISPECIES: HlyD family secretion protein [unclassified Pseudomonas]MBP2270339.1 membrane fusion protein (multidrug efflux system) [Pseudomonas sp. BP6]MBP2285378.1 membrane fusion protein (multidrug efflux system) [Pseudomonas sp. BP7]HDS1697089.1 HlyD family secretion protein [Pseudomonas putida]HDS1702208.1 HlyD family secretion protein [Pseudomonas putida]